MKRMFSRCPRRETGRSQWGSVLVQFLLWSIAMFMLSLFLAGVSRALYWRSRAQVVLDQALLSTLRVRSDGLQAMADKWGASVGPLISRGDAHGIVVASDRWELIRSKATQLAKSLPGYKGRITSVRNIVMEANGVRKEALRLTSSAASDIGIAAQPVAMRDDSGANAVLTQGWYRRNWGLSSRLGEPEEENIFDLSLTIRPQSNPVMGAPSIPWVVSRRARGRLRWDVPLESDLIRSIGNGGYPRQWAEALAGGAVQPYRYPLYWAELACDE